LRQKKNTKEQLGVLCDFVVLKKEERVKIQEPRFVQSGTRKHCHKTLAFFAPLRQKKNTKEQLGVLCDFVVEKGERRKSKEKVFL